MSINWEHRRKRLAVFQDIKRNGFGSHARINKLRARYGLGAVTPEQYAQLRAEYKRQFPRSAR